MGRRGGGSVITQADTAVIWSQDKGCLQHHKLQEARSRFSSTTSREAPGHLTLARDTYLGLLAPKCMENKFPF